MNLLDCASLWIFVLLLSWSVELLWLQHYKTSLPTLCPSTSYFFPVLAFKKNSHFWALSYRKDLGAFPKSFFLRAWSERLLYTAANMKPTKCQMSSISQWSWLHGTQQNLSSNSRSWFWEKLAPTRPSEIPELAQYIRQLWFDVLYHPLESSAPQMIKSSRHFFFLYLMGCFALYFCTSTISK